MSSEVLVVGGDELRRLLPMRAAIDTLERAFAAEDPSARTPLRSRVPTGAGELYLMPAVGEGGAGVKLVTLTPANPQHGRPLIHATYVLFDPQTQAPSAIVDGEALTALRTAAVSALATEHLARDDARRLVVFGAGVQARSHLEAMRTVRPVEEAIVVSRTPARAEALVAEARASGLSARTGSPGDVTSADLVCTCTTSVVPVFEGSALPAGVHVNAVGAYRPDARELDSVAVSRARVVVETREAALAEAGDLLIPIAEGVFDREHVRADLRELVTGAEVRRSRDDVTLFESVGIAFEDLAVAVAAVGRR